jgi:hypothetical protein
MIYRNNIVVWCKERSTPRAIKPCVHNSQQQPPCGYKLCEPMINYLRDYERR